MASSIHAPDLLVCGIVREFGRHGAPGCGMVGAAVGAFEDCVEEVVDQASAFYFGERGQLVHEFQLLGRGLALRGGRQHRPSQARNADLYVQRRGVLRGDFAECEFLIHDRPDGVEAESRDP
ncbi:hypothetical protein ACGFY9_35710 [Streptomyces sp. NPDC048504]|uniref:hypothetical protein n=1 Tax=Streptomyces sp. NPDC048504 TaxID=3365559 RepID=UPI003710C030